MFLTANSKKKTRQSAPDPSITCVLWIPAHKIQPSPDQPRRVFREDAMEELTQSIRENGVLQPISIRKVDDTYYVISGERRLRAAIRAGLLKVPCLLLETDEKQSALFTLLENLQRENLDFLEEALALQGLIQRYGLSQLELAKKLGKSQSSIANKLRLLQLPRHILEQGRDAGLSERHMRAMLSLPPSVLPQKALDHILRYQLNVAQTDAYIASIKPMSEKSVKSTRSLLMLKDVRLFVNSVNKNLEMMKSAGFPTECQRQETEDELLLTIRIAKPHAKTNTQEEAKTDTASPQEAGSSILPALARAVSG